MNRNSWFVDILLTREMRKRLAMIGHALIFTLSVFAMILKMLTMLILKTVRLQSLIGAGQF